MSQLVENGFEVGDLVRVIDADGLLLGLEGRIAQTDFGAGADPYKFESACGEHRGWLSAYQLRKLLPSSVEGEPHRDGLVLLFGWNAEKGCFEESIVEPLADHIADANKMVNPSETPNSSDSNSPVTPDSSTAKRPVVYIAGPMRGIPHFNFPAFDAAKAYLIGLGYDVLSPADFDRELDGFDPYKAEYETAEGCADFPKTMHFDDVVLRDLTAVTLCDAIALLPGWEKSKGAVAEIAVAHWMGKPVMHLLCDAYRPNEVVYIVHNASTTLEQFVLQLAHAHDAQKEAINCAIDPTPPKQDPDCDILDVAASITRGDRQAGYGPPDQDFKKTADMWTGMFQYMLAPGAAFEPRHVAMAMICIKLSREFHQRKRDNWIDIAGYARCGSLCSS